MTYKNNYASVVTLSIGERTVATFEKFTASQCRKNSFGLLITNNLTGIFEARYYKSEKTRNAGITALTNRFIRVYGERKEV